MANNLRNIVISNNIIQDPWEEGIYCRFVGGQVSITGNIIINSNRSHSDTTSHSQYGCIFVYNSSDVVISNNQCYLTDNHQYGSPYGIGLDNTDRVMVNNNLFRSEQGCPGFVDWGNNTNSQIQNNLGYSDTTNDNT